MSHPRLQIAAALLVAALPAAALAASWSPFNEETVATMDGALIARTAAMTPQFGQMITDSYFATGPERRAQLLQRLKACAMQADGEDREAIVALAKQLKMLPQTGFKYYRMKNVTLEELQHYGKQFGMKVHAYRKSGIFTKTHHVLLSMPNMMFDMIDQNFQSRITHSEDVHEFRVDMQCQVGGNWAEWLIPTGQRMGRTFGYLDAWSAAGIMSHLDEDGPAGVQNLVRQGYVTIMDEEQAGQIQKLRFQVYMPDSDEPLYEN